MSKNRVTRWHRHCAHKVQKGFTSNLYNRQPSQPDSFNRTVTVQSNHKMPSATNNNSSDTYVVVRGEPSEKLTLTIYEMKDDKFSITLVDGYTPHDVGRLWIYHSQQDRVAHHWVAEETCTICHDPYLSHADPDGRATRMPCGHVFHVGCAHRWLTIKHGKENCPLCRQKVRRSIDTAGRSVWQGQSEGGRPPAFLEKRVHLANGFGGPRASAVLKQVEHFWNQVAHAVEEEELEDGNAVSLPRVNEMDIMDMELLEWTLGMSRVPSPTYESGSSVHFKMETGAFSNAQDWDEVDDEDDSD